MGWLNVKLLTTVMPFSSKAIRLKKCRRNLLLKFTRELYFKKNNGKHKTTGDQGAAQGAHGPGGGGHRLSRQGRAALQAQKGLHLQKPGERALVAFFLFYRVFFVFLSFFVFKFFFAFRFITFRSGHNCWPSAVSSEGCARDCNCRWSMTQKVRWGAQAAVSGPPRCVSACTSTYSFFF